MRRLAALALLILACGVALLALPLVWCAGALKVRADRLRGTRGQVPDAIAWAVIRAHEAELRDGRVRWQ